MEEKPEFDGVQLQCERSLRESIGLNTSPFNAQDLVQMDFWNMKSVFLI